MASRSQQELGRIGSEGFALIDKYYGKPKPDLAKIGSEGFDLIDKYFGRTAKRPGGRLPPQEAGIPPRAKPYAGNYNGVQF